MARSLRGGKDPKLVGVPSCTACPSLRGTTTTTTTTSTMKPVTTKHNVAALPVQIPTNPKRDPSAYWTKNHHNRHRSHRPRDVYSPDAVPPSIHALLAVTAIPRPKGARGNRSVRRKSKAEDVNIIEVTAERDVVPVAREKELSISPGRSPMDLLLSDPEDLTDCRDDDSSSFNDGVVGSFSSGRTASLESVPSLSGSASPLDASLSIGYTPVTPPPYRGRQRSSQPTRRSLTPVSSSPGGGTFAHPLSTRVNIEELDFRVFESPADGTSAKREGAFSRLPLKSAFKSNLTASLRAIRSAAKSFSSLTSASIPPDDFLTRSILTIDPKVPYTDEKRPPVFDEEPSAALRRYLNPSTGSPLDSGPTNLSRSRTRIFTASIQMQTYKIQRSQGAMGAETPSPGLSRSSSSSSSSTSQSSQPKGQPQNNPPSAMRQREMRENSDFIRIAVLEMAMRKRGKLDDQRPGRARWALPPRKPITKPYEVRSDGVPMRWVPASC